jgi:hypothetical protein
VKNQPDLIAYGPQPTVNLVKRDKEKMIFMVTVYVGGFSTIVVPGLPSPSRLLKDSGKRDHYFLTGFFFVTQRVSGVHDSS